MSNSTLVKNGLIPVVAEMRSMCLANDGCDIAKLVKW